MHNKYSAFRVRGGSRDHLKQGFPGVTTRLTRTSAQGTPLTNGSAVQIKLFEDIAWSVTLLQVHDWAPDLRIRVCEFRKLFKFQRATYAWNDSMRNTVISYDGRRRVRLTIPQYKKFKKNGVSTAKDPAFTDFQQCGHNNSSWCSAIRIACLRTVQEHSRVSESTAILRTTLLTFYASIRC